jgi:hypothetical protein
VHAWWQLCTRGGSCAPEVAAVHARRPVQVRICFLKPVRRESSDCASYTYRSERVGSRNGIQEGVYSIENITKSRPMVIRGSGG